MNKKIVPECEKIEDILNLKNSCEKKEYEFLESCVRINIFSKFEGRRNNALKQLKKFYDKNLKIDSVDKGEYILAYISFNKFKYFFVSRYDKDSIPKIEPVPDKEEKLTWEA
jgi:adenylate cyclase